MAILPLNEDILPLSEDTVLKAVLTHPDAKPALMDLISAFIGRTVTDVQIRNNELYSSDINEKNARLDVNCVISDGSQVDVEMLFRTRNNISYPEECLIPKFSGKAA
jgi:hypothetical protein